MFSNITMLKAVILLSLALGVIAEVKFDGRIVGGEDAALGEIPYIVSVRGLNRHGCGGSIISEKFVLTAAHCVFNWTHRPELFSIQYGVIEITELKPNVVPVKRIFHHEDYVHSGTYPNDIAIIEIDGKFEFGDNAQPVKLPTPFEDPGDNIKVLLAGWGLNKSGGQIQMFLQKVLLTRFTDEYCQKAYSKYDSDMQICAGSYEGGKGQCTMDSGGPLTVNGVQFGIVSWSEKPCGSVGKPGVFTKVTHQRLWIRKNTGI